MCGVLIVHDPEAGADWARARAALDMLAHRGPDGEGLTGFDAAGGEAAPGAPARLIFGHRRLAVLDLTAAAAQPMTCPQTGCRLIFNGEIYNFLELRIELEALGEPFVTDSDSEIILAAWRRWGEAALARFNGMWALALFDQPSGDVIVSRDRVGVKPLYVARRGRRMALASEIRPALAALDLPARPNPGVVFDFLVAGLTDHDPETFFAGVERVPAGALWRIKPDGRVMKGRFHHWPGADEQAAPDPEALAALVADAVRLRLRSDAPTVSFLSGGLDSALITGLAAGDDGPRARFAGAFTYGYDAAGAAYDETARAAGLLARIAPNLPHIVHRASPAPDAAILRQAAAAQQEPFSTPSLAAHLRAYAELRRRKVKVVLTGEGADELFGGYIGQRLGGLTRDALRGGRCGDALRLLRSPYVNWGGVANRLVWDLPTMGVTALLRRFRPHIAVIAPDFWREHADRFDRIRDLQRLSVADRLRADVLTFNLPQILRYADRNSMSVGVEARSPFLDWRVVEHALRLPVSAKLGPMGGKLALRRAFADRFPADLIQPQKTLGFGHAEQFAALDGLPPLPAEAAAYLDLDRFAALTAAGSHPHALTWLPVSLGLWLRSLAPGVG